MTEKKVPQWTGGVENILGLDNELFRKRMLVLMKFISPEDKSIIDFGAGAEYLRKLISKDVLYYPVDYVKRSENTIVCDLNKNQFPEITADVAFMAGFLEYMNDVKDVIKKTARCVHKIILSYKGSEKFPSSLFSSDEVISILNSNGFVMTRRSSEYPEDWTLLACFEKKTPKLIKKNIDCTGCSACANICKTHAISMEFDENGYIKPYIDSALCSNCNHCVDVCPTLNTVINRNDLKIPYAVWAKDEYRCSSSSGGFFSEIAHYFLSENGVVFGAAWTDNFFVEHIFIDKEDDLWKLQHSKYAQSNVVNSFPVVKDFLAKNKLVLFSGTPCQIAGLKSYLGDFFYSQCLFTVDVLCFCVPPVTLFRKYLNETYGMENVKYVTFRDKHSGWSPYGYKLELKNGEVVYPTEKGWTKDMYQNLFHSTCCKNSVCDNCKFADFPRQGDFSIGDFWGINQHDVSWNDGKGTSLVIVNNKKAEELFGKLKSNLKRVQQVPDSWYRNKGNHIGSDGRMGNGKFDRFMSLQKTHSFSEAVDYVTGDKHDIGVVCWLNKNFGNQLTYFALYKALNNWGYSTILIDVPGDCTAGQRDSKIDISDYFENWLRVPYPVWDTFVHASDKMSLLSQNEKCRMFMLGSDQFLRSNFITAMNFHQCMDWVYSNKYKIAYASSFGCSYFEGDDRLRSRVSFFLNRFQKISVREPSGVDVLKNDFGIDAVSVLDPVFLCDVPEFKRLADYGRLRIPEKKYTFAYILDKTKERSAIVEYVANIVSDCCSISIADGGMNNVDDDWLIPMLDNAKVEEWICALYNCDYFITDSFHGLCFALIFHKQFFVVFNKWQWRGIERIKEILDLFGLQDRLVENIDELKSKNLIDCKIDYENIEKRLNAERKKSLDWLKSAIQDEKNFKASDGVYDILIDVKRELLDEIKTARDASSGRLLELNSSLEKVSKDFASLKASRSYRIGRGITWLPRMIRATVKSLKVDGLELTLKRIVRKIKRILFEV